MKKTCVYLIILLSCHLTAQNEYPKIQTIEIQDKIFYGEIDNAAITIYLKFNQYSNHHLGAYSVNGWYYYNSIKTKISLTGVFDNGDLVLYNFNDSVKSNELLNFEELKENHLEDMTYYKSLEGYQEKFTFIKDSFYWTNNNKTLPIYMSNKNIIILETKELLRLDSINSFDLQNFGNRTKYYKIKANKKNKFVLNYEYLSKLSYRGRCSAGTEKGLLALDFDENNNLIQFENYLYESCLLGIEFEEEKVDSENIIEYFCENYMTSESYKLTIYLNTVDLKKEDID